MVVTTKGSFAKCTQRSGWKDFTSRRTPSQVWGGRITNSKGSGRQCSKANWSEVGKEVKEGTVGEGWVDDNERRNEGSGSHGVGKSKDSEGG